MPVVPRRVNRRPRLEAIFLVSVGCLVFSFSILNIGSQSQATSYYDALQSFMDPETPPVQNGPYRSFVRWESKRGIDVEGAVIRDSHASQLGVVKNDTAFHQIKKEPGKVSLIHQQGKDLKSVSVIQKPVVINPAENATFSQKKAGISLKNLAMNRSANKTTITVSKPVIKSDQRVAPAVLNEEAKKSKNINKTNEHPNVSLPASNDPAVLELHYPIYFLGEVLVENLIQRGNLLTSNSGCSIATWVYNGNQHTSNECRQHAKSEQVFQRHQLVPENAMQVHQYDSIYVPMNELEHFVNETLPLIQNGFILLTGQASLPEVPIPLHVFDALLSHSRVLKWFLQNLSLYGYDSNHEKLIPFPYGVDALHSATLLTEIQKSLNAHKDYKLYSPVQKRNRTQSELAHFYAKMQNSRYVLSFSDSRPETHQHYEAIAFGSKPVTSLDSTMHRHLEGSVIFEEEAWNLTQMEETLRDYPVVNRRLAFEEYWMEYIEREVNHRMRWWDPSTDERLSLADITNRVKKAAGSNIHKGNSTNVHHPTYFQLEAPLDKLIKRGNLLRVFTGCSIATWSYSGFTAEDDIRLEDCHHDKGIEALLMHQVTNETASQVQPFDSVYVPIASLERFVANVLPKIQNDFILMTGQKSLLPPFSKKLFDKVIEHPRVIRWFLQNQAVYSSNPYHPKMGIFPYGIFTRYPDDYLELMAKDDTKKNLIYVGYLNKGTNKKVRRDIPRLRDKILPPIYFAGIHNSTYVLSPDGDRPECHRHYEAIGLGAMPITGLDPYLHRHLLGNAVYGERRWKLAELERKLPPNPTVNRRLVFEEYWMEYFEREMGRPLRWWDPSRNVRCSLQDIVDIVKKS